MSEETVERANETAKALTGAVLDFEKEAWRLGAVIDVVADRLPDTIAESYPFEPSFEELLLDITAWSAEARAQMAGVTTDELGPRTDIVTDGYRPEGTDEELDHNIDALSQAAYRLADAWRDAIQAHDADGAPDRGDVSALGEESYPFEAEFDEVVTNVSTWSQAVRQKLEAQPANAPGA